MGNVVSKQTGIKAVIYGFGPFFGYPWKPVMNEVWGGDYRESYTHFREQHMYGSNLLYHCLCFVWQLSSNYAFLNYIDGRLEDAEPPSFHRGRLTKVRYDGSYSCVWEAKKEGHGDKNQKVKTAGRTTRPSRAYVHAGTRLFATLNTVLWVFHLVKTQPTPGIVKLGSLISVYLAHSRMGSIFERNWRNVVFYQGFLEAAAFSVLTAGRVTWTRYVGYLLARMGVWKVVSENEGALKDYSGAITAALVALIAFNATRAKPIGGTVSMGFYGWILSLLTNSRGMYFWSCGMTATLGQAVAHGLSGEAPTLAVLENLKMDMTAYELSHVTYFPNLLFQAIYEHFFV